MNNDNIFSSLSDEQLATETALLRVVQEQGNLSRSTLRRLKSTPDGYRFATVLADICASRCRIGAHVILAVIQLAGGVEPLAGISLVHKIAHLMDLNRYIETRERLDLIPPPAPLKETMPGLYKRALKFYQYCQAQKLGHCLYLDEVIMPSLWSRTLNHRRRREVKTDA